MLTYSENSYLPTFIFLTLAHRQNCILEITFLLLNINFLPFIFKLFHYTLFDTLSYNNNARDAFKNIEALI